MLQSQHAAGRHRMLHSQFNVQMLHSKSHCTLNCQVYMAKAEFAHQQQYAACLKVSLPRYDLSQLPAVTTNLLESRQELDMFQIHQNLDN